MAKKKQITSKRPKQAKKKLAAWVPATLQIQLLSDTTFSRGEGTAGVVDTEVEHDADGLPYIGGKTIRGLLRDSWLSMQAHFPELNEAAARVLGHSESLEDTCRLRIGDAVLPKAVRDVVRQATHRGRNPIDPHTILEAFTTVRYQTAEDRKTGAPEETTLRSSRVVLRSFSFESQLSWLDGYHPEEADLQVLALAALTTRHAGLLRNRGRGHVQMTFEGDIQRTQKVLEAVS